MKWRAYFLRLFFDQVWNSLMENTCLRLVCRDDGIAMNDIHQVKLERMDPFKK
jgi:hypothetical protein